MILLLKLPLNILHRLIAANKVRIAIVFVQPYGLFDRSRLGSMKQAKLGAIMLYRCNEFVEPILEEGLR